MAGSAFQGRGKKRQGRGLLLAIIMIAALLLPFVFDSIVVSTEVQAAADSGYVIENMQVNIDVTDKHVYKIDQSIDVNFLMDSRGIFVHTPYLLNVSLPGADETRYKARVRKIKVPGYETESYTENGSQVIRIGDPDVYLSGRHSYSVSYWFDIGMDHSESADFLYYNIVGPQWTTNMEQVSFSINMPHDFDPSGLNFTVGSYGSEDNTRVEYTVSGRTITGTVPGGLNAFEGLTVYLELPQGYYAGAKHNYFADVMAILLSLAALILVVILYLRFGRDRYVPETVEFYPPEKIDPAHAGYLADGAADSKDMIALIMYWADQGYLHIIEENKKIALRRLRELPQSSPKYQLTIFNGIFSAGDYITLDSLKEKFYTTMTTGKSQLQGAYQDKIMEPSSRKAQGGAVILAVVPIVISVIRTLLSRPFDTTELVFIAGGLCFGLTLFWEAVLINNRMRWRIRSKVGRVIPIIGAAILLPILYLLFLASVQDLSRDPLGSTIISIVCSLAIIPFAVIMDRRTAKGQELYSRLMGFRSFMLRAEKGRLEALVQDNPSYFYDILPYAYVLGVSDKWAKNFDGLAIQPPTWYYTDTMSAFTVMHFANQMNRTASDMNRVMISQPASSSGGGSGGFGGGGGGFSGGGFGGGGGGRW